MTCIEMCPETYKDTNKYVITSHGYLAKLVKHAKETYQTYLLKAQQNCKSKRTQQDSKEINSNQK